MQPSNSWDRGHFEIQKNRKKSPGKLRRVCWVFWPDVIPLSRECLNKPPVRVSLISAVSSHALCTRRTRGFEPNFLPHKNFRSLLRNGRLKLLRKLCVDGSEAGTRISTQNTQCPSVQFPKPRLWSHFQLMLRSTDLTERLRDTHRDSETHTETQRHTQRLRDTHRDSETHTQRQAQKSMGEERHNSHSADRVNETKSIGVFTLVTRTSKN